MNLPAPTVSPSGSRLNKLLHLLLLLLTVSSARGGGQGFLTIRDGYFWDSGRREYYYPRGVAYQTWNPPVGANQTLAQMEYDLVEFRKIYANSVRCEFVWSQLQAQPGVYDWSRTDFLVQKAEALGLRLFVLIGFQYPPAWFPAEWRGVNDRGAISDVLNYEHPEARRVYREHIAAVVSRYKNSPAIAAWILGNEFAYFDLWEDPALYPVHRFLGYDAVSQASFREFLRSSYHGDIAALSANWNSAFPSFDAVTMPARYPANRDLPGYHDLIQWRKSSIGRFVAGGAAAAKAADPNHLITYSMVGGIFSGTDANHTAEDARSIVDACRAAGAPLDFWAVNNYGWASIGSEMRSADFGIAKYQEMIGLPVLVSETGHSSTENLFGEGAAQRQPKALPSQLWEAVMSGAIGFHFFHWNDRNMFTTNYFLRERGFGIVQEDRLSKGPVYSNMVALLRRMEEIRIDDLLGGSTSPPHDVLFYWSRQGDMGWPRANQENAMVWGALKRLGYQPGIMNDEQFDRREYTNAAAVLLSRAYQLAPSVLDTVAAELLPAGIHLHANADLPGQFDAYHRPNANWVESMRQIFGLETAAALPGWDSGAIDSPAAGRPITLQGATSFGTITPSYSTTFDTWKIWHGIRVSSGTTVLTHRGVNGTQPAQPALHFKDHGSGRAAISTFALGDTSGGPSAVRLWDNRYQLLRAIYQDYFQIPPRIQLSGTGAPYVIPDYRICRDGSILLSFLNEHTAEADVQVTAPSLLNGKTVRTITAGSVVDTNATGQVHFRMAGDDFVLLHAGDPLSEPLIAIPRSTISFTSVPPTVWPNAAPISLEIAHETTEPADVRACFEQVAPLRRVLSQSAPVRVSGPGVGRLEVMIPEPNLLDSSYISSRDGGEYRFVVWLEKEGVALNRISLPVRLLWPVIPHGLPLNPVAGQAYEATLEWQELPADPPGFSTVPLDRAVLWDSLEAHTRHYALTLQLHSGTEVIASDQHLTSTGSGAHPFTIQIPSQAAGPLHWTASIHAAPEARSFSFEDGFEGRERGAEYQDGRMHRLGLPPLASPWMSYVYSEYANQAQWQNEGVNLEGRGGGQAAFLVMTNNLPGGWAGFGFQYDYPADWALPSDPTRWTDFTFSVDFREVNRRAALVELQVKNKTADLRMIHFIQAYEPGPDGWCHVQASLDRFVNPTYAGRFDPAAARTIVVNIQMLETKAQYVAFFDNIHFAGPVEAGQLGPSLGYYSSANDAVPDGGPEPVPPFNVESIRRTGDGFALLSWAAQPDRTYAVYYSDEVTFAQPRLLSGAIVTRGQQGTTDLLHVVDPASRFVPQRFYRIAVVR